MLISKWVSVSQNSPAPLVPAGWVITVTDKWSGEENELLCQDEALRIKQAWWLGWSNLEDDFPSPQMNKLQSAGLSSQLYSLELTQPSKAWTMWSGISRVQQAGCQKNLLYSYFNMNFYELGNQNEAVVQKDIAGRKYLGEKKKRKLKCLLLDFQ